MYLTFKTILTMEMHLGPLQTLLDLAPPLLVAFVELVPMPSTLPHISHAPLSK
jgi:hypothetical protein